MAEITPVAEVATLPSIEQIERAGAFTREPFLTEGEDPSSALTPGSPRRRALDAALAELETGAKVPSVTWRRQWSLLLGLDRLLSQDEPTLVDGTVLSAHQVDALSGTLTALLAEALRNGNGNGGFDSDVVLAPSGIPGEEDDDEDEPEEPHDWDDRAFRDVDADVAEAPEDPNAAKRFWFEHATGAGKTVAALGFVEASRTGGVLILTHRRNLVDQFHGELRDRGYAKRITPALFGHDDSHSGPVTVETYQWFVRNAGKISDAYTIVICDEAHTALGEKTSGAIRAWTRPDLHRHDGHGRADRPPRHRPLPDADVALRPRAGRPARRHRPAALRAHPARPGGPDDRQGAVAPRRGGHRVRPGDAGPAARSAAVQPGRGGPLQDALQRRARRGLRRRRAPRLQRRPGVPRPGDEGAGRVGRDAQARAGPDPGPLRARRHRRAGQRAAAGRGLELAARDRLHAPGADGLPAHLPAARRPRHPPPSGQGGGHRRRLRPSGDQARRPGGDVAFPAGSRRLSRRGDRGRPGAPRPRTPAARRAPRAAGDGRREPADRGLRARAVADRRRASRLRRAGPVGGPGRRARGPDRLAPGTGDAPLRPGRRAQAHVPDHRGRSQQEPAAAPARAAGDLVAAATPRRSTARWTTSSPGRATTSARPSRSSCRRWPRRRSAAATRPTTGSGAAPT